MQITIKVEGLDKAMQYLKKFGELFSTDKFKIFFAEKAINEINKVATQKLKNSGNYNANNKYEIKGNKIVIYNDIQSEDGTYISLILEYGSGVHKEGDDFHHTSSYDVSGGLYWLVPVENSKSLANTNYPIITIKGTEFYMVFGQQPKHIYNDAAKIIEQKILTWANEYIEKEMK